MTNQDKPNSTSDKESKEVTQEPVTEYTLCENFIRQYKKFKLGMLEDGAFLSVREQQALVASIIGQPSVMQDFIGNTVALLVTRATEEFPILEEKDECVTYFNSAIYGVIFKVVIPLLKMPEETKIAIREKYREDMAVAEAKKEKGPISAPFEGLDFAMPNEIIPDQEN